MPRPTVPSPPEGLEPALRALHAQIAASLADPSLPSWRTPWVRFGLHRGVSGRRYALANQVRVFEHALKHAYTHVLWLSRSQGERLLGKLRDDAVPVTIYSPERPHRSGVDPLAIFALVDPETPAAPEERRARNGWHHELFPVTVYNAACFMDAQSEPEPAPRAQEAVARVARLVVGAGVSLRVPPRAAGESRAYYHFVDDRIGLPHPDAFLSPAGLAATALHELVHWTGAPTRLDRHPAEGGFREDADYAFEELVAELGAMMLCAKLGVDAAPEQDPQHLAYLRGWFGKTSGPDALWDALVLADRAARLLERLDPAAFAPDAPTDEPRFRSVEPSFVWAAPFGSPAPGRDTPTASPELVLDAQHLPALRDAWVALEDWASGPRGLQMGPALAVLGRPEDGPETLMRWLLAHLEGAAPLALVRWPDGRVEDLRLALPASRAWSVVVSGDGPIAPTSPAWLEAWSQRAKGEAWDVGRDHLVRTLAVEDLERPRPTYHQPSAPWLFTARPRDTLPELVRGGAPVFAVHLNAAPLGASAAAWVVGAADPRPSLAGAFRVGARARDFTDLNRHARGEPRRARPRPYAALEATLPFLPVTLAVAQAFLDGALVEGRRAAPLPGRLRDAHARLLAAGGVNGLIPLAELLSLPEVDADLRFDTPSDAAVDLVVAARALETLPGWRVGPKSVGALVARRLEALDEVAFWERVAEARPWVRRWGGGVVTTAREMCWVTSPQPARAGTTASRCR